MLVGGNESVHVFMSPRVASLEARGISVEQTWTQEGVTEEGWHKYSDVKDVLNAVLSLSLTNDGSSGFADTVTVQITSSGQVPEPSVNDLRVEIHQR